MMNTYFNEVESDFYQYLTGAGGVNGHSRTNYMAWLRFLSASYLLPRDLSDADIDDIIDMEEAKRLNRDKYTTSRDMTNFKSALRKYRAFLNSDFLKQQEETVLAEVRRIEEDGTITETERTAITKARVGQGRFREDLIRYWRGCSISAFPRYEILIASHIRPWAEASNAQRLDVFNGLLLLPNYDKLFDKGYVSFGDDGKIVYSTYFPESDRRLLGMDDSIHLMWVDPRHRDYLDYHRKHCLMLG